MSRSLVDTQAALWFLAGDDRLSERAQTLMTGADEQIWISAASIWEIAMEMALGKPVAPADLLEVLDAEGFAVLDVSSEHAWAVSNLPTVAGHEDPVVRLLIAQARVERLPIISSDASLDHHGVVRAW